MPVALQPALIIGLGGSGIEIVRRFRHRLDRDYEDQSHVRFLGVDTDVQKEDRDGVPRLKDGEFIHASNFSPEQYVSANALSNYPEIREWWRGYDRIALGMISTGAGQRRPVGRLALFVHFAQIRQAMARQIGEIFKTESFHRLPPEYRKQVTIYIVASTCGGTGTGMFLDLAYLAPVIVQEVQPQADSKVRGLLLLPSVFTGTNTVPQPAHTAMRANGFGALTELDWCMNPQGARASVKYPGMSVPVERSTPPFKSCFLLGNQDEQGAVYTEIGELFERAATHLHTTLASSLSTQGRSDLDNIEANVFQDALVQGRARLYSSMNAGELVLPRRRVLSMWARDFAILLAKRLDGGTTGQGSLVQKALEELERRPAMATLVRFGRPDSLLERMNGVEELLGRLVSIDAAAIDQNSIASDAMYAQSEFTAHLSRLKVAEEIGKGVQDLRGEVDAVLGSVLGAGSLTDALAFVTEVRARLDKLEQQVAAARGNGPIEDWATDFAQKVTGSKKGFKGSDAYARSLGQLGADAGETARRVWRRQLASRVQGVMGEAAHLPTLRSFLEQRRSLIERLRVNVPGAEAWLRSARLPLFDSVLGAALRDAEIQHAFLDQDRQERMEVTSRPLLAAIVQEPTIDSEELGQQLVDIASHSVREPMAEFMRGFRFDPADIATRLSRLQPLVSFTKDFASRVRGGSIPHPPQPARLLGVPEGIVPEFQAARGEFEGTERGFGQPVAIRDPDRILMISQTHGFPLFAVAEMAICRQAIDADSLGRILRFTLPDADARNWQIFPALASEANKWFAVAVAVGAVTRDLDSYTFVQPGDERAMPLVLFEGEGGAEVARREARDAFNRQGVATGFQQGLKAVSRAKGGNAGLVTLLDDWVTKEQAKATNPRYPAEFKKDLDEVSRFADSIREEF